MGTIECERSVLGILSYNIEESFLKRNYGIRNWAGDF